MQYSFNFRSVWRYQEMLVDGALLTLELSALTMFFGLLLGVLGAGMRTSSFGVLRAIATSIVSQIATEELSHVGTFIESRTFRSFEVYLVVTRIYLAMALFFRATFAAIHRLVFERR